MRFLQENLDLRAATGFCRRSSQKTGVDLAPDGATSQRQRGKAVQLVFGATPDW